MILDEVIHTVQLFTEVVDQLPPDQQRAAYAYMEKANRKIGEARDYLRKARIIAGIEENFSEDGNVTNKLGYHLSRSAQ